MINLTLVKSQIKSNWIIIVLAFVVLSMYSSIIVFLYDPDFIEMLSQLEQSLGGALSAFGMSTAFTNSTEFMANYLYGFILVVMPAIFVMLIINFGIAKHFDRGSISYMLSSNNSRKKIIMSLMSVVIIFSIALIAYVFLLCVVLSQVMYEDKLLMPEFTMLNVGALGVMLFFGAVAFFAVTAFSATRRGMGIAIGVIVYSVLVQMLSQVNSDIEVIGNASPLALFDASGIVSGDLFASVNVIILYACSAILFFAGAYRFCKRDICSG